jgi:hypothetical protein
VTLRWVPRHVFPDTQGGVLATGPRVAAELWRFVRIVHGTGETVHPRPGEATQWRSACAPCLLQPVFVLGTQCPRSAVLNVPAPPPRSCTRRSSRRTWAPAMAMAITRIPLPRSKATCGAPRRFSRATPQRPITRALAMPCYRAVSGMLNIQLLDSLSAVSLRIRAACRAAARMQLGVGAGWFRGCFPERNTRRDRGSGEQAGLRHRIRAFYSFLSAHTQSAAHGACAAS